jgi:hypothetical protein
MLSARTVGAKGARLIDLSFNPAVSALEALVDDRLPDASRASHQWLWQDRISGALTDENLAHQRYGEVFDRAGETKHAVRQFILAGRRKDARSAAESLLKFLDVRDLLEARARWVCSAAAAVIGQQADLIPDGAVSGIAARLTEIVTTGAQTGSTSIYPVQEALGALAALDERLPAASAQQVLPLLVEWIPREPNVSRFLDKQMVAYLGACIKAKLPVADQAAQALLDAWKLDIKGAEGLLAGLRASLPSAVSVVRERAQQGHTGATALLADWQVDDPSVAETARDLAETVLTEPVGTARPFYAMGTTARQCAAYLTACSDDQSSVGTGEPTGLLRERVAAHLLLWAEDHHDIVDRRSEAVRALSILAETLPAPMRDDTFERLMGLYQDLTEHPANAFGRRTQHPLSRYKINAGGDWRLPAEVLHATAVLATTAVQAIRVEQRLLPHLTHPGQKPGHSWLQAQTMLALDRLTPAPTSLTATHPSPFMRQTAVICWGRADHRDPSLARIFAEDSNTSVRHNLAHTIAELPPYERLEYEAITERLRTDNSARVRRVTAQIP